MKKYLFSMLILCVGVGYAQNIKFEEYDLKNGLHVILHKDNSNPLVAVSVSYKVGSKNEQPDRTGFAHFFEHLLFEGSKNIKRGEFMKLIKANGGQNNANTSFDRTYYYEVLPSNKLELALWLESERLMHAKIDQKGVEIQREVVKEEKRMRIDNKPYGRLFEEMYKRLYKKHPYRWMIIGSMAHIDEATLDEFMKFYKHFYVPNNAVLTIAGDIDIKETKKLVKAYFGNIPKGTHKIYRPNIKEERLTKEVVDTVYDPLISLPAVIRGYITPKQTSKDAYVMQVISYILSMGSSSMMHKELVEKQQLAIQSLSFNQLSEDYSTFLCGGIVNKGIKPEKLAVEMDKVVEQLKEKEIDDKTYTKILNNLESGFIKRANSMQGIAELLADNYLFNGDTNLVNTDIENYRKITKKDILRVARKYLDKNSRVTIYYLPKKK